MYRHLQENCHCTLFIIHLLNSNLTFKSVKDGLQCSLKCTFVCPEYGDVPKICTSGLVFHQVTAGGSLVVTKKGCMFRICCYT